MLPAAAMHRMDTRTTTTTPKRNQRNYYRILFVQPDAPMEIVQASYRTLMQKLKAHPDLGGSTWNATVINEAYETLIDPEQRVRYDAILFADQRPDRLGLQSTANRQATETTTDAPEMEGTWEAFRPHKL